jgi:AcrR family transcriptional regulator
VSSLRNNRLPAGPPESADDAVLDAARASILAVGWRRSTLTDVARRAGVSRMTIYRRWPEMRALVADLMTREWGRLGEAEPGTTPATALDRVAGTVCATIAALREDELFSKIVHVDPELLLPYLLDRRGRTQDALLAALEAGVLEGQRDGSVRDGDPVLLARTVLLASYGFVLSARTMTDPDGPVLEQVDAELRRLVAGYLTS